MGLIEVLLVSLMIGIVALGFIKIVIEYLRAMTEVKKHELRRKKSASNYRPTYRKLL